MGATTVMLLVRGRQALVGHMGDSRLYRLRDHQLEQITHDHSITQYLIDTGEISENEAADHESSGRISQYVGMSGEPLPGIQLLPLETNDRLLLCSDGLNSMLGNEQINQLMANHKTSNKTCHALIEAAKTAGGKDNITSIVIDIQ